MTTFDLLIDKGTLDAITLNPSVETYAPSTGSDTLAVLVRHRAWSHGSKVGGCGRQCTTFMRPPDRSNQPPTYTPYQTTPFTAAALADGVQTILWLATPATLDAVMRYAEK